MSGRRLTTALGLAALAAALASCGGGEGGEPRSDEQEIRAMLRESNEYDPRNCVRFQTLVYTEQTTKEEGEAAIRACEEAAREAGWEDQYSTEVVRLEASEGAATLQVAFEGSVLNGQTLEFALVERAEGWKYDEMLRFIEFNRAEFIAEFGVALIMDASPGLSAGILICMVEGLQRLSGKELENLMLGSTWGPLLDLGESCNRPDPPAQPI